MNTWRAAMGMVAHSAGIRWLVAKGVSDFGDEDKDDHFRIFAARASAAERDRKPDAESIRDLIEAEIMQTLEQGRINAGAIFFVAAILSTFVFGRFFCGWGCHIVALQDLCGAMMKKMGIRYACIGRNGS